MCTGMRGCPGGPGSGILRGLFHQPQPAACTSNQMTSQFPGERPEVSPVSTQESLRVQRIMSFHKYLLSSHCILKRIMQRIQSRKITIQTHSYWSVSTIADVSTPTSHFLWPPPCTNISSITFAFIPCPVLRPSFPVLVQTRHHFPLMFLKGYLVVHQPWGFC